MKVKDIMAENIKSISGEISVKEAMDLLFKHKISGLPVLDKKGLLIGMFTEKDILKTVLPGYVEQVGKFIYDEDPKIVKKKMQNLGKIKVKEIMRKDVITVSSDTALGEVARLMLTQKVRRVPVVDKDKKVIGIVAREDIVRAFAKNTEE
ncbi:MAG: CBS domain-containing protein [Candidatus Omnitrophota bacterium]